MAGVVTWESFYVMAGGAAAALTGLVFVAISLHGRAIMGNEFHRDRAWSSVALFATQLFISMAVLYPSQTSTALGLEVGVATLFWVYRTIWVTKRLGPAMRRLDRPRAAWQAEWVVWFAWIVAIIGSVVALIAGSDLGPPLLALAMVGMFAFGIWNAWVLISEIE